MVIYNKLSNANNFGNKRSTDQIRWIVMHYTGNDGDTAKANANYFANNIVKASAHYFVDDKNIYRSVPDDYVAWSVGGSRYSDWQQTGGAKYYGACNNTNSISVEMCDTHKDGKIDVSDETLANAVDLVRMLMSKYNVPLYRVICHFDVNGKRCPNFNNGAWILGSRPDFQKFKSMLEVEDMTREETQKLIDQSIDNALAGYNSEPSKWAEQLWDKAKALGVVDGQRPKGYATREQIAAIALKIIEILEDDMK